MGKESDALKILARRDQRFGTWIGIETRTVELPSHHTIEAHIVKFPDIALIVAVDAGDIILVRQFRFPPHLWLMEAPAGRVEVDEDPSTTALRELSEETGFRCNRLAKLGELRISPHLSDERTHVYLATELTIGESHPEKGELIEAARVPCGELRQLVSRGELVDAKTISALVLAGLL